ncbi:MAG: NADH-quinone oxidoreductase subunit NuoH [Bacteriovoracaceae bacterium]
MNSTVVSYFLQFEPVKAALDMATKAVGFDVTALATFAIFFLVAFVIVNALAAIGGLGTYAERKISADMQMRIGPNRVGPYGLLQFLADGVKMIMKEDILPNQADKFLFFIAPMFCIVGVFATLAVLPFSSGFTLTHLDVGSFYLIAISSLVGLGVFLGGYASNSKWSMLGGMRGASQIISYEIPVTISVLGICLLSGSMAFNHIIENQGGLPHTWFIFHNPFAFLGFFVYFTGALAETNRAPFDLPEAESELVSGYHTEYSGMKFGFFALAEYIEVFVVCGVASALFLGGYNVPFHLGGDSLIGQLLQLGAFFTKTLLLYYVVIWIRWTLPRLRVDQLMTICWKYLTPIALFNLVGMAFWVYLFNGKSMFDLIFAAGAHAAGGH